MADPNEVKHFKQYLNDTNVIQPLVEILSSLRKCDPKPADPMEFIREKFSAPVSIEEFNAMKQTVSKLNDDMCQMKVDVAKILNMVTKLMPELPPTPEEENVNLSVPSMVNSAGNLSHIGMLSDSSLIFDETLLSDDINATDLSMVGENAFPNDDEIKNTEFTLEMVELDVVSCKGALDVTITTASQEESAIEAMQADDTITETHPVDISATDEVAEQSIGSHDITIIPEEMQADKSDSETESASSSSDATITEQTLAAKVEVTELEVVPQTVDHFLENVANLSKGFCGFYVHEVEDSIERFNTIQNDLTVKADESQTEVEQSGEEITAPGCAGESYKEQGMSSNSDAINEQEESFIVEDIAKVVEGVVDVVVEMTSEVIFTAEPPTDDIIAFEGIADKEVKATVSRAQYLEDDAETKLFLSYC